MGPQRTLILLFNQYLQSSGFSRFKSCYYDLSPFSVLEPAFGDDAKAKLDFVFHGFLFCFVFNRLLSPSFSYSSVEYAGDALQTFARAKKKWQGRET